jgi:hypothetical protein
MEFRPRHLGPLLNLLCFCWTACTDPDITARLNTSVRTAAPVERPTFQYESLPEDQDGFCRGCFVRLISSLLHHYAKKTLFSPLAVAHVDIRNRRQPRLSGSRCSFVSRHPLSSRCRSFGSSERRLTSPTSDSAVEEHSDTKYERCSAIAGDTSS